MLPAQRPDNECPVADAFGTIEVDAALEVAVFFGNGVGHFTLLFYYGKGF